MDFAKSILEKYGWKEGQGIGRNKDGISKPIRASMKFDATGFGHDKGEEYKNHWWERAFDAAANNLDINQIDDKISVSLKNGESIEIATKDSLHGNKLKSEYAGAFIKSRFSLNKEESSEDEEIELKVDETKPLTFPNALTDEDLFRACGGRTAHKGARHGLKLSGKLNRIEEQERKLLEKFSNNSFNTETAQAGFKDWIEVTNKKKKKKKKSSNKKLDESTKPKVPLIPQITTDADLGMLINQDDYVIKYKSKKSKKKAKSIEEDLVKTLSNLKTHQSPSSKKDALHSISSTSKAIHKKSKKIIKKLTEKVLCDDRQEQELLTLNAEVALETTPFKIKRKAVNALNGNDSFSDESFSSESEERALERTLLKQLKGQIEKREFEKIAKKMEKAMSIEDITKKKKKKKKKSNKKRKMLDQN